MFKYCPKIEKACAFCGEANWNPITDSRTDEPVLFCGMASGYETRVAPLPECWLKMSKSQRTTYANNKRIELQGLQIRGK